MASTMKEAVHRSARPAMIPSPQSALAARYVPIAPPALLPLPPREDLKKAGNTRVNWLP